MPSCAGTGMATICMLTLRMRSIPGWIRVSPGPRTVARTLPNRNTNPPLKLPDHPQRPNVQLSINNADLDQPPR
jgi:hypothetical protein